jgi:AraC-like DNA-binding protein
MSFWRLEPQGALARHVDHLWASRREALPHRLEWLLPSGRADLVIPLHDDAVLRAPAGRIERLRGGVFQGASAAALLRGTGDAADVVGVHFRPGGAAALFGGAAVEASGQSIALTDFPGDWAGLRERLLSEPAPARRLALLAEALAAPATRAVADPLVDAVLQALHATPTLARIDALRALAGLGPTRFIARFHARVGLTPKRYARVLRFGVLLPTLARCGPRDWAQVAAGAGYFDQSHLIREFRQLAGITPGAYAPVQADPPTHVALAR